MNWRCALTLSAAVLLLSACATTPQAQFYTLIGSALPSPASALISEPGLALAVGPIDLPEYLDRPQIVSRIGGSRLLVDEFNRWGGDLRQEMTRVLAGRLATRLDTQRVYAYPSRIAAFTELRLAIEVRVFDGELGGNVDLDVAWALIDERGSRPLGNGYGVYQERAAGPGHAAFVEAMARLLERLGDDMAASIAEQRKRQP